MKRMMNIGLGLAFAVSAFLLTSIAGAQTPSQPQDPSSLADYARKVHKDTGAPKAKPKVFDNDNLPKNDKLSIVGAPPAPEEKPAAAAGSGDKSAAAADSKASPDGKTAGEAKPAATEDAKAKKPAEFKSWQDKLTQQKDQINLATRELDVLQREYELRAAVMYADAGNRLRNSAQWDKEETKYKQDIADKQKAVEDAKQKLEDMKEEARRAGVPSAMIE